MTTIGEMLERNARVVPNKVALVERIPSQGTRKEITWRDLNDRVNRIANALVSKGVQKGDRVIHWMMNSIDWLAVYFAITRTGAWAVPLSFRFTSMDLKYCIEVAEPKLMVLDEGFVPGVKEAGERDLPIRNYIVNGQNFPQYMESLESIVTKSSSDPLDLGVLDKDPCALYFTSGTTGKPKPILLTNRNLECQAITGVVHGTRRDHDVFVILKPLYHTGDMINWLPSLILGAPAVIQRDQITSKAIFEVINEEKGTVLMLLVPWIHDLLKALDTGELRKEDYDLSSWRLVLLGAQPVPPELVRRLRDYFPNLEYELNYGLTESSGPTCIHLNSRDDHKLGSIGKAGFNWEAKIVNEQGDDLPAGQIGEIAVKGNGVMKEYYKNPEKTRETIKNGWLLTGDMGKMDKEGYIWIVDRKKDLIISGGENVYSTEVEEVLYGHPSIQDVGVVGLPDERLGEIVVAIVELKDGTDESIDLGLSKYCEEMLPRYKRPRRFIFDKVPRNVLGKIDKVRIRQAYATTEKS